MRAHDERINWIQVYIDVREKCKTICPMAHCSSEQNSITFARLQMKELFYSPIFSIHQMDVSLILVALFRNFSTRKGEKTFRQKSNCFTCQKSSKWKQNFLLPSVCCVGVKRKTLPKMQSI